MKGYIIKFENELVCVTDNPQEWLKENNKERIEDKEDLETLNSFQINKTEIFIYGVEND